MTTTMQPHEIDAWLGDTTLTDEQRATFEAEISEIMAAYPDPDDQDVRDAAMSAALQYILGETSADEVRQKNIAAIQATANARAAVRTVARLMSATGVSESQISRDLGVTRITVRAALGKQ